MIRFIFLLCLLGIIVSCSQTQGNMSREEALKWQQYQVKGKSLYQLHCSNCHGPEGNGLVRLYPPLKNTDWVVENSEKIPCVIKNGISGELQINGIEFSGEMPGHEDLTNLEIAEVTSFILSGLNEITEFSDVNEIVKQLEACDH